MVNVMAHANAPEEKNKTHVMSKKGPEGSSGPLIVYQVNSFNPHISKV